MTTASQMPPVRRSALRESWIDFLERQEFNVGLTLNLNMGAVPLVLAHQRVRDLFFRVDRRLLGTRFTTRPAERTHGVLFVEHPQSNLHLHGLLRVRPDRVEEFASLFPGERGGPWSDVCASGTHFIRDVQGRAAAAYVTKAQSLDLDDGTMIWLDQFYAA